MRFSKMVSRFCALLVVASTSHAFVATHRPTTTTSGLGWIVKSGVAEFRTPLFSTTAPPETKEVASSVPTTGTKDELPLQQDLVNESSKVYRNGLITVALITLLFASNSPVLHAAFSVVAEKPPVLLLNAAVGCIALLGVSLGGPILDKVVPEPSLLSTENSDKKREDIIDRVLRLPASTKGGIELGLWKFLGTTANLYGLSMTSAGHGAFLIQLTTLIVPVAQGIMGVPIPTRIWTAIALALSGVLAFTQDPAATGVSSLEGDLLCVVAAVFYATYDLRLFHWGKLVAPLDLISSKVTVQASLSIGMLMLLGATEALDFINAVSAHDFILVAALVIWSGVIVNGVVPYLQVGGQQAVGPARAQIIYASQPLWAAIMSFFFLGESVGINGLVGGSAFLVAMMLAATAEAPDADCEKEICEV